MIGPAFKYIWISVQKTCFFMRTISFEKSVYFIFPSSGDWIRKNPNIYKKSLKYQTQTAPLCIHWTRNWQWGVDLKSLLRVELLSLLNKLDVLDGASCRKKHVALKSAFKPTFPKALLKKKPAYIISLYIHTAGRHTTVSSHHFSTATFSVFKCFFHQQTTIFTYQLSQIRAL